MKDQGVTYYCKSDWPSFPIVLHLLFVNISECRNGKDVLHGLQKPVPENLDQEKHLSHINKPCIRTEDKATTIKSFKNNCLWQSTLEYLGFIKRVQIPNNWLLQKIRSVNSFVMWTIDISYYLQILYINGTAIHVKFRF